jgi:hypothetical protein
MQRMAKRPTSLSKRQRCALARLFAKPKPRAKSASKLDDDINQTFCLYASAGHLWMRSHYDNLPLSVRRRLRNSPFNLCPWCLVVEVLPNVQRRHPAYPRERALFAAIEIMESKVRKGGPRPSE